MSERNGPSAASWRRRLPIVLVALVCVAPMAASYFAYYVMPRERRTNYGELAVAEAPLTAGTTLDGRPFALSDLKGRWVMVSAAPGGCDDACQRTLYATRQARTIQGRERERVVRLWLVTDDAAPSSALTAEHPDLTIVRVRAGSLAGWPRIEEHIHLVDPLGNEVLAWPRDPDIKALAADLTKLLRASQVG